MKNQITLKNLEAVVSRINKLTGSPEKPYSRTAGGKHTPNANCYHLSSAYGGYSLHRMSDKPGCTGVSDVFRIGHVSKRELYNAMFAFIEGIEAAQ